MRRMDCLDAVRHLFVAAIGSQKNAYLFLKERCTDGDMRLNFNKFRLILMSLNLPVAKMLDLSYEELFDGAYISYLKYYGLHRSKAA